MLTRGRKPLSSNDFLPSVGRSIGPLLASCGVASGGVASGGAAG
jgi:hypothetical protein